jgi:hypothetical protein
VGSRTGSLRWISRRRCGSTVELTRRRAATERIARTHIVEADARVHTDPESGALVEGHFLEKAIAVLRTIPRSYRLANGLEELARDLRIRLQESRESSIESMMRIESGPVDLTGAVSYARSQVAGRADKFQALAAFVMLMPPMDEASTREHAVSLVEGSISHVFPSSTFSSDFRKVAVRQEVSQAVDDSAVWSEMVRTVYFHAQVLGRVVQASQEVLTTEHRFDRQYMTGLCTESPTVPQGHEGLWGVGLALGMDGNYAAAVCVLVPQLEQVVRSLLKRQGVHTLFVDDLGVESEKSLNALLDMAESEEIFGAGLIMEMKAMLIVQGGPNLRNDIAHGLLNDNAAWSYSALYMWWFCLRLVMHPVIAMVLESSTGESPPPAGEGDDASAAGASSA